MGATFSADEYIKTIRNFSEKELTNEHFKNIEQFFVQSTDFFNVFTSSSLEDYRQLKRSMQHNLIFLISKVSSKQIDFGRIHPHSFFLKATRIMHEAAIRERPLKVGGNTSVLVKGAIHFLNRVMPLIYEDKEFYMRAMWHEQSSELFESQVNAIMLVESIALLLFKPGFTIQMPTDPEWKPNYFGKPFRKKCN